MIQLALVIVAEYSFFLWDQELLNNLVINAIKHYQQSTHCKAVMEAAGLAFDNNHDQNSEQNRDQIHIQSSFELSLIQIALTHRLCMLVPLSYLFV